MCLSISLFIQGKLHGYTEEEQVRNLFRAKLECEARIENATDLFPGIVSGLEAILCYFYKTLPYFVINLFAAGLLLSVHVCKPPVILESSIPEC